MNDKVNMVQAYYKAIVAGDFDQVSEFLHDSVTFKGPMGKMSGKSEIAEASKGFSKMFEDINFRHVAENKTSAMVVYDLTIPALDKPLTASGVFEIENGKIKSIELIYDSKPLDSL